MAAENFTSQEKKKVEVRTYTNWDLSISNYVNKIIFVKFSLYQVRIMHTFELVKQFILGIKELNI